jgi:hypothetical protein
MARNFLLYLYSMPNMVGAGFALIGLLLFFSNIATGIIGLSLIVGLYLVGMVVGAQLSRKRDSGLHKLEDELSLDEMKVELERLAWQSKRKLPRELSERVDSIKDSILSVLPTLASYQRGDFNLFTIRQTALEYLPEAIENYLKLPTAYANYHPVQNGKTARQLLLEQLILLDDEMEDIAKNISDNDTQKLIVHGRFLADKFKKEELLVR